MGDQLIGVAEQGDGEAGVTGTNQEKRSEQRRRSQEQKRKEALSRPMIS